jgi:hypothetical protein
VLSYLPSAPIYLPQIQQRSRGIKSASEAF